MRGELVAVDRELLLGLADDDSREKCGELTLRIFRGGEHG